MKIELNHKTLNMECTLWQDNMYCSNANGYQGSRSWLRIVLILLMDPSVHSKIMEKNNLSVHRLVSKAEAVILMPTYLLIYLRCDLGQRCEIKIW